MTHRSTPVLTALLLLITLPLGFFASPSPAATPETPVAARLPVGMNLAGINDYTPGFPFKNLMWGARAWLTRNAEGETPWNTEAINACPMDENGYPLAVPFTAEGSDRAQTVFTVLPNVLAAGDYVLLYDGEGEFSTLLNTSIVSAAPGRVILRMAHKEGAPEVIVIKRSARGNHVRNVRILSLSDETADLAANPFRDDFLAYCKQWHALRFMDWQMTNGSLQKEWNGRKRPTYYTMVGSGGDAIGRWGKPPSEFRQLYSGGVALELIIQLANMTQTDPWLCVPHRATPEYMTEMALLVKEKLDPKLKVYVEYSNEVWNWQFQQAGWMLQSKVAADAVIAGGRSAWKGGAEPELPYDDGTVAKDGGENHPERTGALNRRLFAAWEAVFTGDDRARMVRVIGVQHSWTDTARRTAKWVMANGGADAISPAGYFGPNKEIYARWEAAGASLTADQVIADMHDAFDNSSAKWTRDIAAIAKELRLKYIVYEGGQHIQPKDQKETAYLPALKAAQYHPGMFDVYMKNFALHQEVGCELFMAFSSVGKQGSRVGSWGHQEHYGQPAAEMPKLRALLEANAPRSH